MLPGHPHQRVPNATYPYNNQDPLSPHHPQHNAVLSYGQSPGHSQPQTSNSHPHSPSYSGARPHMGYIPPPTAPKPTRYPGPLQAGSEPQRPPLGSDAHGSVRPSLPPEDVGYRDSPPPPPPPTSTHPLYQSGNSNVGQKLATPSGNPDNR